MTYSGHIRNGAIVLDHPAALPEGAPLRVEVLNPAEAQDHPAARRRGGQFAGRIWMAPDFDDWPDDLQEALGMAP